MARKRKTRRIGYIRCRICRKRIPYTLGYVKVDGVEPGRLRVIRKHWSSKHPKIWRQSILAGVKKRMKRRKRLKK